MIGILGIGGAVLLVLAGAMLLWRWSDHRADAAERLRLVALQPARPARFDPATVAGLPDPARRFFSFAIAPGTPLWPVADIAMQGRFSLGSAAAPGYMRMSARQTLASPHGFVWQMRASRGALRVSGSDSGRWTRFWLMGIVPVARPGGDADHARAAFGRHVAEAVFWTPAAVLPGPGIVWTSRDADTARVTVTHGGLTQAVDVTVADDGRPRQVAFGRWSNANPERAYRVQPFGGTLSAFGTFDGFTLPTHVEAGNGFGTDDYFAFFIADVSEIRFPQGAGVG